MKIKSVGVSDIGLVRLNNEDVFAQLERENCFLLADGMGGHKAGEVAASETVAQLCILVHERAASSPSVKEWVEILDQGIQEVNESIFQQGMEDPEKEGMGTTLCLGLIAEDTLITAHVGDSRIYRLRKGRLSRLTRDHSLKHRLMDRGELDESHATTFPYKNVITRAIGTQKTVNPEIHTHSIETKDLYFLCSDGLTDILDDAQIQTYIERAESLEEAVDSLILETKKLGGNDNITIVMFQIQF